MKRWLRGWLDEDRFGLLLSLLRVLLKVPDRLRLIDLAFRIAKSDRARLIKR